MILTPLNNNYIFPTRDEAAEKCPTRDASPPLVLAFLQEPSATTKRYHQTLPLMGAFYVIDQI
ncbi:hypothetical protein, partial [Prevotellamassilia timonensis]|uniref:hypothetical protein n=1 Tax=Prevotellamassilia timonensis TaxID=1852370 RepID=UPI00307E71DE